MKIVGFSWIALCCTVVVAEVQQAGCDGITHSQQCCQFCWISWLQWKGRRGCDLIWGFWCFKGKTWQGPCFPTVLPLAVAAPGQLFCSVVRSYLDHTSGEEKNRSTQKASEQQRGECLQAGTKLTLLNRIWEASAACLNCLVQNKCFLWSKSKAEHTDLGCTLQISAVSQLPLCAGWAGLFVVTWLLKEAKIMLDEKI